MNTLVRYFTGDFNAQEIKRYLVFVCVFFWGFIFLAWLSYPKDHHYSIMTHTFSFLGSWDTKHNPQWWWLFSIAMLFWGVAGIPLVMHIYSYFQEIMPWGARLGAGLLIIGCLNIGLVGIFPDARTVLTGELRVTDIHTKVAIFAAAAFILGISWHGIMLLLDLRDRRQIAHRGLIAPYVFWATVLSTASYFLIKWEFVYAEMKTHAQAAGIPFGSSWSEAMNTRYSFPLWENLSIYTLFIFLVWFSLVLTQKPKST